MKCDTCLHHCRSVVSENGLHFICGLSARAASNCITGKKDHYVEDHFREVPKMMGKEEEK